MTVLGKQITEAFYGKPISYSYWKGCSTGGRQGLMMAQRYPDEYDGILAEAPAINWATFVPASFWPQRVMHKRNHFPNKCEFDVVTTAAIEACDELDGLKDGVIGVVGQCTFQPESIVGHPYSCGDVSGTISAQTVAVVRDIWAGPHDLSGKRQWYGLTQEAEFSGQSFYGVLANTTCSVNGTSCTGNPFGVSFDWHRVFLARNETFDPYSSTDAQWDAALHHSENVYTSIMGTSDPDLSLFRKSGGKMITWHGTADQLIAYNGTFDYYKRVLALDPDAPDFYRVFSAPGVQHCTGGPGAPPTDPLAQLVQWVEDGRVPETLKAEQVQNGTRRTRSLCRWPKYSLYKGGNVEDPASFECV